MLFLQLIFDKKEKNNNCKKRKIIFHVFLFLKNFNYSLRNSYVASVSNELIYFSKLNSSSSFFSFSSDIPLMTHGLSAENISENGVT